MRFDNAFLSSHHLWSSPFARRQGSLADVCSLELAVAVEVDHLTTSLVITADRTGDGPLLVSPRSHAAAGAPATEHWVLDNFAADPPTGASMPVTAETVARDGAMTRSAFDELALLRHSQYQRAPASAGHGFDTVKCLTTHSPFALNDLWFAQQTGYPQGRMNPYGCSLIFGHPQGPAGLRSIVELVHPLRESGGGGLFTGCPAGNTGAALVLQTD